MKEDSQDTGKAKKDSSCEIVQNDVPVPEGKPVPAYEAES